MAVPMAVITAIATTQQSTPASNQELIRVSS